MGGVDHFDERELCAIERQRWNRIFNFLVDLINSLILWKLCRKGMGSQDQQDFRLLLSRQLDSEFSNRKRKG
ncbi:hypothetical protein TNCV_3938981 [Trichonephila clavipes]|nr:hypothetical protein TNCV_3938981 [Trichonephila clavipes]